MNDREKDRRGTTLVGSGSGEDGIDERLGLSGDEIIECLNESSPSENKKTNSFFLKAYRMKHFDAFVVTARLILFSLFRFKDR
jgi:hypothetical protein